MEITESLSFLKRYWFLGISTISVMVIFGLYLRLHYVHYISMQRDSTQIKLAALNRQIQQQNAAIAEWKSREAVQTQRLQEAMGVAKKERLKYQQEVNKIMSQKVSTDCGGAIHWGAQKARELVR